MFAKLETAEELTGFILNIAEALPFLKLLLILMVSDVIIGTIAAVAMKQISSTVSAIGMGKKGIMLAIVGVCTAIGKVAGMPLGELCAMGFCLTELWSIVENSARAGVPFPTYVIDILKKLQDNKFPISSVTVTTETATRTTIQEPSHESDHSGTSGADQHKSG